jgi:hypothetical protein
VNRFQIRRQRLHVNLVNGNRLIGFLNQADDEEDEDLFHEAEERAPPTEAIGLASFDRSSVTYLLCYILLNNDTF